MTDDQGDPSEQPTPEPEASVRADPRASLAIWANESDEWVRLIVRAVLVSGSTATEDEVLAAYELFRQEKEFEPRTLPSQLPIEVTVHEDDAESNLAITCLSEISGVNALVPGSVIEPHAGLTILFGENGTGKTGYARIFKTLADSRTAVEILGNISNPEPDAQAARVQYKLDDESHEYSWTGERGVPPFTRMSIFDSPSVSFHVDEDLEYVFVPSVLALFNHVIAGVTGVQRLIDGRLSELSSSSAVLLSRFPRGSTIYPKVETLGASTDLPALRALADTASDPAERIETLRLAVSALEANTTSNVIRLKERELKALEEAEVAAAFLSDLNVASYNTSVVDRGKLREDHQALRSELFETADLPAPPDETWNEFIASGEKYRSHLETAHSHDPERCLYCRQPLDGNARSLISKYGEFLDDKIGKDIDRETAAILAFGQTVGSPATSQFIAALGDATGLDDPAGYLPAFVALSAAIQHLREQAEKQDLIDETLLVEPAQALPVLSEAIAQLDAVLVKLRHDETNRETALVDQKKDLIELEAAVELGRAWPEIERTVGDLKEADRLKLLAKALPKLSRAVTGMSKTASDRLINDNFDKLFLEECRQLRAPDLKLDFVGKKGRAHRRKSLEGSHKPSKVLSEGEQKVLAIADFLAEARLTGISAPVIFDDPVSSLDHRRIREVAARIAGLAEDGQVIVFTHDILFATNLMALFEESKRCTLLKITDDDGKGRVDRATGLRWDTIKVLKAKLNTTIEAAQRSEGEARAALVREGYDWIRAWCEVFAEMELLEGVSQRYQPNVRMTVLSKIKTEALPAAIEIVNRIYEEACRYIPSHSQPLATLSTTPKLADLEAHWKELQDCRDAFLKA